MLPALRVFPLSQQLELMLTSRNLSFWRCAVLLTRECSADASSVVQTILEAGEADLQACVDRDPACEKFSQCMLYFKGFQAIQCHRLNHWLWKNNRKVSLDMCEPLSIHVPVSIHFCS